jgi:hypothetical protein
LVLYLRYQIITSELGTSSPALQRRWWHHGQPQALHPLVRTGEHVSMPDVFHLIVEVKLELDSELSHLGIKISLINENVTLGCVGKGWQMRGLWSLSGWRCEGKEILRNGGTEAMVAFEVCRAGIGVCWPVRNNHNN